MRLGGLVVRFGLRLFALSDDRRLKARAPRRTLVFRGRCRGFRSIAKQANIAAAPLFGDELPSASAVLPALADLRRADLRVVRALPEDADRDVCLIFLAQAQAQELDIDDAHVTSPR